MNNKKLHIASMALTLIACILMAASPVSAKKRQSNNDESTQVVLQAAKPYSTVVLNTDLTVELVINPKYAGYIVYNRTNDNAPKISCISSDSTLLINTTAEMGAVSSRVRVICGYGLHTVINNGSGRIICSGISDDMTYGLTLINNGAGDIGIRKYHNSELALVNNGAGRIGIKDLKCKTLVATDNGSGNIYTRGKAERATLTTTGTGNIVTRHTKIKDVEATVCGTADISCHYLKSLTAVMAGSGNIYYYSPKKCPGKNINLNIDMERRGVGSVEPSDFK